MIKQEQERMDCSGSLALSLTISLCLGLSFFIPNAMAGAYQCTNEQGTIEFRDSPCKNSLETQEFLPIQYSKSNAKDVKKQLKSLAQNLKKQTASDKKQQGKKVRGEKQKIKAEAREQRRQEHCARVKEKIIFLENQLKAGAKLKHFERLKTELEHYERMKKRYCVT